MLTINYYRKHKISNDDADNQNFNDPDKDITD